MFTYRMVETLLNAVNYCLQQHLQAFPTVFLPKAFAPMQRI